MRETKAVYVAKHDIKEEVLNKKYLLYTNNVLGPRRYNADTNDVGVQYNQRSDNLVCTCRLISPKRRQEEVGDFSGPARQIYVYHGSKSHTNIGVGTVNAHYKKKVRRIHLGETDDKGVGSSDLSSYFSRRTTYKYEEHQNKKSMSSKCVGGVTDTEIAFVSKRLSPMGQTFTRNIKAVETKKVIQVNFDANFKNIITTSTQTEKTSYTIDNHEIVIIPNETNNNIVKDTTTHNNNFFTARGELREKRLSKLQEAEKVFSSDSLIQHVHNLEDSCEDKNSAVSVDIMENKLEREYRKIFCVNSKTLLEETALEENKKLDNNDNNDNLLRRFEALRQSVAKKEETKRNTTLYIKDSSNISRPSRKDVSIVSDPPSLEGRSYSNTKLYPPYTNCEQKKSSFAEIVENALTEPLERPTVDVSDCDGPGVKDMFRLWGKMFNLDGGEEVNLPDKSGDKSKKTPQNTIKDNTDKKECKIFTFFKKRSKDKIVKQTYKPKKGVTAGRCEVGDGFTIKIGTANKALGKSKFPKGKIIDETAELSDEMIRKAWLQQFLARTIESRKSVKIRWNNKAYATSSSTIFEMMENVYSSTGVVLRSQSDITTEESSYYKYNRKHRVNFNKNVEAWMFPIFILDKDIPKYDKNNNIKMTISDQKWFIDNSKEFAHKIEVVLHSRNVTHLKRSSSEYLTIDIPKGFFTDSSSTNNNQDHISNEEVFKIVEYLSPQSRSFLETPKNNETCDQYDCNLQVTVSTRNCKNLASKMAETITKDSSNHRTPLTAGSNEYMQKKCDVIGVSIITQKDVNSFSKSILKSQDDHSNYFADTIINHIESFAEKYITDYYRRCEPSAHALFCCVSDSHLQCCSEYSKSKKQTKCERCISCPNIYNDQTSVIALCGTSYCNTCSPWEDEKTGFVSLIQRKFKPKENPEPPLPNIEKRILPKDSHEVYKKRKMYALSNKSKWRTPNDNLHSIPILKTGDSQDTLISCPKTRKVCCKSIKKEEKRTNKKHVSLPDCETMNNSLVKQLDTSSPSGILTFKRNSKCDVCNKKDIVATKSAEIIPGASCTISSPNLPCQEPKPTSLPQIVHQDPLPSNEQSPPCIPPWIHPQPYSPKSKCTSPSPPTQINAKTQKTNTLPNKPYNAEHLKPQSPISTSLEPYTQATSHTSQTSPRKSNKPKKRRKCWSPGRPSCGSPTKSGITLRTPPKSSSSTSLASPSKSIESCALSTASSLSLKPSPCQKISPQQQTKQCKQHSPRCLPGSLQKDNTKIQSPQPYRQPLRNHSPCCKSPPRKQREARAKSPKSKSRSYSACDHCKSKQSIQTSPVQSIKDFISCFKKRHQKSTTCSKCMKRRSSSCVKSQQSSDSLTKEQFHGEPPYFAEMSQIPRCQSPCRRRLNREHKLTPCKSNQSKLACEACKKISSQEFPWPLKNQHSNQPSLCSVCPEAASLKDLKPNICQNKSIQCPSKGVTSISPPNISGIFLKMNPANKSSYSECPAKICDSLSKPFAKDKKCNWTPKTTDKHLANGIVKTNMCPIEKDSFDDIIINIKKGTASTEEIREGLNIKVQDFDGNTLYERRDYFNDPATSKQKRHSILNDTYKNSHCHTMSTSRTVNKVTVLEGSKTDFTETKNLDSVTNLIEINFNFKVTQADKTSNMNVANCSTIEKQNPITQNGIGQTSQVFAMKDEAEQCTEDKGDKNDINVKIIIKNFKPKNENNKYSENFTKRISEKLQTVSTGYSDGLIGQKADNPFAVQRANFDLSSSREQQEIKSHITTTKNSKDVSEKAENYQSDSQIPIVADLSSKDKNLESYQCKNKEINKEKTVNYFPVINTDDQVVDLDVINESPEPLLNNSVDLITKALTKDEKQSIIQKVFSRAPKAKKIKKKQKMKQLKEMLRVIFTDSSDHEEMKIPSKDLVKEMTYTSLKSSYFGNTDSVNDLIDKSKNVSSATLEMQKDNKIPQSDLSCTSGEESQSSDCSETMIAEEETGNCLCNIFAKRLNIRSPGEACCCKKPQKSNKEIMCDFEDEDILPLNSKRVEDSVDLGEHKAIKEKNYDILESTLERLEHKNSRNGEMTLRRDKNKKKDKECPACLTRRILGITNEAKLHFLRANPTESRLKEFSKQTRIKRLIEINECKIFRTCENPSDILQSYETKKAVLQLYTQTKITKDGECLVARLPKFVSNKLDDIRVIAKVT